MLEINHLDTIELDLFIQYSSCGYYDEENRVIFTNSNILNYRKEKSWKDTLLELQEQLKIDNINKIVSNSVLKVQIFIDGYSYVHDDYAVDLSELEKTIQNTGKFLILNCSCGDLGCAGLSYYLVNHKEDIVEWVETPVAIEKKMKYLFDYNYYKDSIKAIIDDYFELLDEIKKFENLKIDSELTNFTSDVKYYSSPIRQIDITDYLNKKNIF